MIEIKVIASGSSGNCTVMNANGSIILLDAGISYHLIQKAVKFKVPAAAFITHEHCDHAERNTLMKLMARGTKVYMTKGTAGALRIPMTHSLITQNYMEITEPVSGVQIMFVPTIHDAAEPASVILLTQKESLVYCTDTAEIPPLSQLPQYFLIEANYQTAALKNSDISEPQRQRILKNHLSIEYLIEFLQASNQAFLKEIHLLHISQRHGNPKNFKEAVRHAVKDGVKIFAH